MNGRIYTICIVIMILFFAGCGTRTNVTSVWTKGDFAGPPMQSLMILAQTGDEYNRLAWENIITERFRRSRMNAVPASGVFPENSKARVDLAIDYAREQGIDGVLVISYVDTRIVKTHHPPEYAYYFPRRGYYPIHRDYYPGYRGRYLRYPFYQEHYFSYPPHFFYGQDVVITPGYMVDHRVVLVGSYLYQTSSGEQVWNMSTDTYDPRSENDLVGDISRSIFRVLQRYGLISLAME